ncbi:MAG: hypothetical protein R2754_12710 [Microthrixaceae bacterium]
MRPTRRAVPYQPPPELEALENWINESPTDGVAIAVVHGAGGTGKTRLCVELGVLFRDHGWTVGFVPRGKQGSIDERFARGVEDSTGDALLFVDYADARDTDDLVDLLRAAYRTGWVRRVRLVFTTPRPDWWERVQTRMDDRRLGSRQRA